MYLNADLEDELVEYVYTFLFENEEIIYHYKKNANSRLVEEELTLNNNRIFYYNLDTNESDFQNLLNLDLETINIDIFLADMVPGDDEDEVQEIPFLRYLINNTAFNVDSLILKLSRFIQNMHMINVRSVISRYPSMMNEKFYESLNHPESLQDLEEFLNAMGVDCQLAMKELPDGKLQLYFKHQKMVPFFENASSGTLALISLYRIFELGRHTTFMYLDDFDAYYHYEMSAKVIKYFKQKYPKCQVILTTHNTNLMNNRLMRPECLFILSSEGTLTSLNNATQRELREGHNLEKMYISGEFNDYE